MMDFLRRLAPPRETDATRAFAVLPSRYSNQQPLREMTVQDGSARRPDDDEAPFSPDSVSPPAANNALAAQSPAITGMQPFQAAPQPLRAKPTRRDSIKAGTPAWAPAETSGITVAGRADQIRLGEVSDRATPEPQGKAPTFAPEHALRNITAPPAQARLELPLSPAVLAKRTLQPRDDSQVVHVTIGRIDVVANTAPAPAARRSPAPRQATVTLADYLRGGHGSRP